MEKLEFFYTQKIRRISPAQKKKPSHGPCISIGVPWFYDTPLQKGGEVMKMEAKSPTIKERRKKHLEQGVK